MSRERPLTHEELVERLKADAERESASASSFYRSAPGYARRRVVWSTLPWVTLSVIAVVSLHANGPSYSDVAAAVVLFPVLAYLVMRGAAVSLVANRSGVVIRNPYRTYSLVWAEIEKVEPSRQAAIGGNWEPVIVFRTTARGRIKARAVTRGQVNAEWAVEQVLQFAPGHIAVRSQAANSQVPARLRQCSGMSPERLRRRRQT